ncbi:MAG: efflux transporter periplasmic adaptor subunit [Bacteroidota bacterium]|jgi:RND family efflux transporter MFP subunit|nr:efflux transporter periplasmic adaptor subunit [Bacteroidota bacterium]
MKKLFFLPVLAMAIMACNSGSDDKKAELEKLKKEEAAIKGKIAALEAELSTTDSTSKSVSVSVTTLKAAPFKNFIDVQGRVDADENISLSTEMPGTITKINVKVGDEVSAGQVLAETDARTITQQISDLQTNTALVNQVYEKQKNLWDQKIGTEIQFLQAKTNKESMEKKMATLQEQLRMTKIIAPISGTVDAVDVKLGQAVAPGMPAIRVINFSNLKVKAEVAESYASKVKKGSQVIVHFPDTKDSLITKVNFVSRAINNASRTFTVEVLLDDKKEYHPNMVARLNINDYESEKPAITVPVRTVQKDESNMPFVFVAENGIAKKRIVTLGKEYKGQAEVLSGVKEGDVLVTLGYDLINDGDAIVYNK